MADDPLPQIEDADWPLFGWSDDVRPSLGRALAAGRPAVLATLYRVEGSAPRGPGAQMLFDGPQASGYFSGDCIESDVARHAAEVFVDGQPRHLHYGAGSPWIDIRLRCGGALHILVERIAANSAAALELLAGARERRQLLWSSDGANPRVIPAGDEPILSIASDPLTIRRRYDPPRRLIVSGGDPGALAIAKLGVEARFETILIRPSGPETPPPLPGMTYLRAPPADALADLKIDPWTAYVGATHEDHYDLPGCLHALRQGAGYVAMIGAKVRAPARRAALVAGGAGEEELSRLRFSPGVPGLGKAPWELAVGIMAEIMQALSPAGDRQ